MTNKRIYDLTEDTTPTAGDYLATDKSGLTEATKVDVAKFTILAGQSGGQTLYGDTAANGDLILHGTSSATRTTSYVLLQPTAGNVGIGTTAPASLLHANLADTGTNAVATVLTLGHNSSGTPAAGFGSRVSWLLNSSTTDDQPAAALDVAWSDATHATRTSYVNLQVVNDAGALTRWLHNYADATADGYNIFVGFSSGNLTLSPSGGASSLASRNVGVGYVSLYALTTGFENVAIGTSAGSRITTGYWNTALGVYALNNCATGTGNVAVGRAAGYYETGSNKLFIDNDTRASEADGRAKALVYGVFAATTAAQTLALNAVVTVSDGVRVTAGSVQVGGTAARGTVAGTNRIDIFDGTAPTGTLANGVSIYSKAGEFYALDALGNETLNSPHDPDTGEWIFWSRNTVTGRTYRVDMERMVAAIEALTGQSFTTDTFSEVV